MEPPRMTAEQRRDFFRQFCDGQLYTSLELSEDPSLLPVVFLALAFLPEPLSHVALVYEELRLAGPRSVNGHPTFLNCRLLHVDDWAELRPKIADELRRRQAVAEGI